MSACRTLPLAFALLAGTAAPSTAQSLTLTEADRAAITAHIAEGRYGTVTSVLVLLQGEPVYEAYFEDTGAATRRDTRSVTKTITGMAVGAAIADGDLAPDTRVATLFAELQPFASPDPRKNAITVEDLMTMSSVMECNDWNEFSRGNEERMYVVEDWSRFFWDLPVRGFPAWQTPPDESPYGRAFSYCTAGVQLLGETVERATGERFTDYAERRILAPLGVSEPEWPRNSVGQAHMGGGLRLTTRELGAVGELQRRRGAVDDRQLLPREWIEASVTPHASIPNTDDWEYGYLWWLLPYEVDSAVYRAETMTGNGGNRVMVLPEFGVTLVYTSTDYNTQGMHERAEAFFETEIVARLSR
jgi:CubicO group peptidase (beta-lactamase class C family)